MIKELKKHLRNKVQVLMYASGDGAGDNSYSSAIALRCYTVVKNEVVTNSSGVEVISTTQVYLDGDDARVKALKDSTLFILDGETKKNTVKAFNDFYEYGRLSLRVVYL